LFVFQDVDARHKASMTKILLYQTQFTFLCSPFVRFA
jgi:hypothetical protein